MRFHLSTPTVILCALLLAAPATAQYINPALERVIQEQWLAELGQLAGTGETGTLHYPWPEKFPNVKCSKTNFNKALCWRDEFQKRVDAQIAPPIGRPSPNMPPPAPGQIAPPIGIPPPDMPRPAPGQIPPLIGIPPPYEPCLFSGQIAPPIGIPPPDMPPPRPNPLRVNPTYTEPGGDMPAPLQSK